MVGLLANRALAWLVLGGGGLAVIAMLWTGAVNRGKAKNDAEWRTSISEKVQETRQINHAINQGTLIEDADLRREEERIAREWQTRGKPAVSQSAPQTGGK